MMPWLITTTSETFSTVIPNQIHYVRKGLKHFSCRFVFSFRFQCHFVLLSFPPDVFRVLFLSGLLHVPELFLSMVINL